MQEQSLKQSETKHAGVVRFALENFRSHAASLFETPASKNVFVIGRNGAGKTNLLEALSLFSPGRGLRGASPSKWQAMGVPHRWSLAMSLETADGLLTARMGPATDKGKSRAILFNQTPLKRQLDLQDYLFVFWMTPEMDLLFRENMGLRRRFFDRLVMGFDKAYAPCLLTYEKILSEWRRLLECDAKETAWLSSLETMLAEKATLLTQKRFSFLEALSKAQKELSTPFAPLLVDMAGVGETAFKEGTQGLNHFFRQGFEKERHTFQKYKPLKVGPQATKIVLKYDGTAIELCSMGQQKLVLFLVILGACHIQKKRFPLKPFLLLLDEPAAHLDRATLHLLFELLDQQSNLQTWVTATEKTVFQPFQGTRLLLGGA